MPSSRAEMIQARDLERAADALEKIAISLSSIAGSLEKITVAVTPIAASLEKIANPPEELVEVRPLDGGHSMKINFPPKRCPDCGYLEDDASPEAVAAHQAALHRRKVRIDLGGPEHPEGEL